jgi:3-phosphoshikimate 1-carboxyvinyltransferase
MIDEFPALFVAAACAEGATTVRGAEELRVKESDRIAVMAAGLRALGIRVEETPDGAVIEGGGLQGGTVESHGDHRCAMAFAVAGAAARGAVTIRDCANVATSFPDFTRLADACGLALHAA